MINKLIIESLYGLGSDNYDISDDIVDQHVAAGYTKSRDFVDNVQTPKNKPQINNRQREIYSAIYNNQYDVFVSYPPSAGKTMPVKQAIMQLYQEKLLNPNRITPHILYVVPRKQLAAQIADNDFRMEFIKLISGTSNFIINGFNPTRFFNFAYSYNQSNNQTYYNKQYGDSFAYNLVSERTGGNKDPINMNSRGTYDDLVPVIVSTYEEAVNILNNYSNKITHIIIDEVQELVSHPGEGLNENLEKRYKSLVSILSNASKRAGITLMTGSINQNSIKFLCDYFNKTYKRNFRIIPEYNPQIAPYNYGDSSPEAKNTTGQLLNRSQVALKTMKSLSGYPQTSVPAKLSLIKSIVVNKQFESVMIIFSKQRSKQGIFGMLEALIKILPPYPKDYFFESASNHVTNVINGTERQTLNDRKNIEFLKYFDYNNILQNKKNDDNDIEINPNTTIDEQNILYQSVIRGIAPLVGSMDQLHKKIIQYYFSEKKKIHLVLGTDALGYIQ